MRFTVMGGGIICCNYRKSALANLVAKSEHTHPATQLRISEHIHPKMVKFD